MILNIDTNMNRYLKLVFFFFIIADTKNFFWIYLATYAIFRKSKTIAKPVLI